MLFNSNVFLFGFLPLAILGFYWAARGGGVQAAKVWLCLASFFFYGWWNPAFLLLLVGSIAFNYTVSRFLDDSDNDAGRRQSWLLGAGIAANLLLLFYYKYLFALLGFFHRLGWNAGDFGSVILPIGISFFTFTQIGYLVDCRQGLVRERGLLNYVLFVTFFPHLIAGPILHHREIMPQFADEATYRFNAEKMASGLTLFAFGLFKKVMLADEIAPWAEHGFAHTAGIPFVQAWSVALSYSMQLYFDFSGYSDMAIGLGIMFGVKLPLNFNSPYKSSSVIEFWQRWHMTLTRYLTLLLYNPISLAIARRRQERGLPSGRQAAATPMGFMSMIVFPTMVTMFLAGIWHGAGFQFIVYGLLFGTYLCINHAWRTLYPPATKKSQQIQSFSLWGSLWPVALTYLAVLVTQVFFRADSAGNALDLLAGMVGVHSSGFPLPIPLNDLQYLGNAQHWVIDHGLVFVAPREAYNSLTIPLATNLMLVLGLAAIAFAAPNVYQIMGDWSPALTKVKASPRWPLHWSPTLPWALGVAVMMFLACQHFDRPARFLYFQF
jgi:alginate O-acetyltransferase complex protein AlgI